jgi:hypothetical protein
MSWLPKTIFFGRHGRGGRLDLDGLREVNTMMREGRVDPEQLHLLGKQRRQQVGGPLLWVLLLVAVAALILVWSL